MKELKINRGVELMLRGERPKKEDPPLGGIVINKVFSFLSKQVYFNFELRWEKEEK
jgi:hypothetical protein